MKRSQPLARRAELATRTRLDRSSALRRVALVRATTATVIKPLRRKRERGEFSPRARLLMWLRFDGLCACCGRPLPRKGWTAQHRRARGAGGTADPVAASVVNGLAVHELPCHRFIEDYPRVAERLGRRVNHPAHPGDVPVHLWDGRRVVLLPDGGYVVLSTEENA